ncbi:hypothetical protein L1049_026652 [Liquidambar formosana]|uniref:CBM-cenC domain-containing protein n=1 Tax=Liquidambar formosana TaxID=63359 RepID=A0AAP0R880_LIQFO
MYIIRKVSTCCFTSRVSKIHQKQKRPQTSRETMENPQTSNDNNVNSEKVVENMMNSRSNIIVNHDFSQGLHSWHLNCCDGFVVSAESGHPEGISAKSGCSYAVITNRKECWQGLEQDITGRVSPGSTYTVSACVGVSGPLQGFADVQATLKLEYRDSSTSYLFIGRTSVSKAKWEKLEGKFSLSTIPDRVVFYVEGPSPGVDLLIQSVVVTCSSPNECESTSTGCVTDGEENIILNPRFEDGLNNWSGRGCKILLHNSMGDGKILPQSGNFFASATERTQSWNGIQQEITGRVQRKLAYEVTAIVRIFGNNVTSADVRTTLWVQTAKSSGTVYRHCKFAGNRQGLGTVAGKVSSKWFPIKSSRLYRRSTSRN